MARVIPPDTPKGELGSLRHLFSFIAPYRWYAIAALLALCFTSGTVLGLGSALRYLIDEGLNKGDPELLNRSFLVFIGVILLLAITTYIRFSLVSWIGERVVADIRAALYRHVVRLDIAFFETARTGDLLSRITTDSTLLQTVVGSSVSLALRNTLLCIGGIGLLLYTNARLTGYVALILPLVVVPIVLLGRQVRRLSRDTQDRVADINAHAEETLSSIRTLQALSLEQAETTRFANHVEASLQTATRRIRMRALLTAIVISLVFGAIAMVLWVGGHDLMEGRITAGDLSSFIFYSVVVAGAIGAISEVVGELQRAAGATERMMGLLAIKPQITGPASPAILPQPITGHVRFEGVTFTYPARPDRAALQDFDLEVRPGETVALVGPSGAGKTTVFQLLLRYYDPNSGTIRIDGADVRTLDPQDLRRHFGLVPQDPVIFSASARENIRFGRIDATDAEVVHAADTAACTEFLARLPNGFDTYLGEKGVRLSGGQRQRLAIARAMVRNPRILLLDEATSALDAANEAAVQKAIEALLQDRTTIVIAHRLATVKKANRIVVMNEGKIEAIGTHASLLLESPLYANLAALQFQQS